MNTPQQRQMTVGRTAAQQQLQARGAGGAMAGGEAAVVADALNDVMGKMLTVVTKKTRGYVGSTYKKTEDRIAARMRSMEEKITGFEQVRCWGVGLRGVGVCLVWSTMRLFSVTY
jgi:hypothetical protein